MLTLLTFKLASLMTATAISAAAVVGSRYRKGRQPIHFSGRQFPQVFTMAHEAVKATEQQYTHAPENAATNQQKLAYARDHLLQELRQAGISIDRQGAEEVIEAYMHCFKTRTAIDAARPVGKDTDEVLPAEERGLPWTS